MDLLKKPSRAILKRWFLSIVGSMATLISFLPEIIAATPIVAAAILDETADELVDMLHSPGAVPRLTGNLQDSYRKEVESPMEVAVGTDVEYAPFVEYGTSHMAAQPHLGPVMAHAEALITSKVAAMEADFPTV